MKFSASHLLSEQGPLDSRRWSTVAVTRKALHVRIHQLRAKGYWIESAPFEDSPVVAYILVSEPRCERCGR